RRREVDRAHRLAADRLEGDARRRHVAVAEEGVDVVEGEDLRGLEGELLGEETRVVRDHDARSPLARLPEVVCDALAGDADVLEREVFADDATPARRAELDHLGGRTLAQPGSPGITGRAK